jgi:hypothetical protein
MDRFGLPGWYNGTLYRSHLEARWQIFFDSLEVKARYEPQGFDLGDGIAYLPDFAVFAALGTLWAEVKPEWDSDPEGVEKWRRFAAMRPGRPKSRAVLLVGPPSTRGEHIVIGGDDTADDPLKGPWEDNGQVWRPCPDGRHFDLAWPGKNWTKFAKDDCPDHFGADGEDRIAAAVKEALSYRFGKFGPQPPRAA